MKEFSKSSAPVFVAYGADPSCPDPKTHLLTKENMASHLDPSNFSAGFENGQIICAVVPIDYKYPSPSDGSPVLGEVSTETLSALMEMKAAIASGEMPKYSEPKPPAVPKDLPKYIGIEQLKELLVAKGYGSHGTQGWDASSLTYFVVDPDGKTEGSHGGFYGIRPVNNPIWGKEETYEPKFCTAQAMSLPDCPVTSGIPLE